MGEVFGIEDYVVVTKDGCDAFPGYPKESTCVGCLVSDREQQATVVRNSKRRDLTRFAGVVFE